MVIGECFHDLRINDHLFINEDVRDQRADQMTPIMDGETSLLLDLMTLGNQFQHKRVFLNLFVEARPQTVQHFHGGTDDRRAEFAVWIFVFHSRRTLTSARQMARINADDLPNLRPSVSSAVSLYRRLRLCRSGQSVVNICAGLWLLFLAEFLKCGITDDADGGEIFGANDGAC